MTDAEILEVIHLLADQPDQARQRIRRMNGLERITLRTVSDLIGEAVYEVSNELLEERRDRDRRAAA